MKSENVRLTKKLKEVKATLSAQDAKLQKVMDKAEYYKNKYRSIEMFTTVKVRTEVIQEYVDGKSSSWNLEADFKSWEKMKKEEDEESILVASTSWYREGPRPGRVGRRTLLLPLRVELTKSLWRMLPSRAFEFLFCFNFVM